MPHLFLFVGLPLLALIFMGVLSVGMWLMSSGSRKLIGLAVLGMLAAAWLMGSYELAAGALAVSVLPLVSMALLDRVAQNTIDLDKTLDRLVAALFWLDCLVNWMLGGDRKETLSSVAYRMSLRADPHWRWQMAKRVIEGIFWWEPEHCRVAFENYQARCAQEVSHG